MNKLDTNVDETTVISKSLYTLKVRADIFVERTCVWPMIDYEKSVNKDCVDDIKQALQDLKIDNYQQRNLIKKYHNVDFPKYRNEIENKDNRIKELEEVVIEGNQNVQEKNHKLQAKIKELKEDNRNINWAYNMQREIIEKHNSKLDKIREYINKFETSTPLSSEDIILNEIKSILNSEVKK